MKQSRFTRLAQLWAIENPDADIIWIQLYPIGDGVVHYCKAKSQTYLGHKSMYFLPESGRPLYLHLKKWDKTKKVAPKPDLSWQERFCAWAEANQTEWIRIKSFQGRAKHFGFTGEPEDHYLVRETPLTQVVEEWENSK